MPLLASTAAGTVDHVCLLCGAERRIPRAQLRRHSEDSPGFSIDCASCGSTESFAWHDWVYVTGRENAQRGIEEQPDPDHPGARQMVLIERAARALGFGAPARIPGQPPRKYPRDPRAPSPDDVREYAARVREGRGPA